MLPGKVRSVQEKRTTAAIFFVVPKVILDSKLHNIEKLNKRLKVPVWN